MSSLSSVTPPSPSSVSSLSSMDSPASGPVDINRRVGGGSVASASSAILANTLVQRRMRQLTRGGDDDDADVSTVAGVASSSSSASSSRSSSHSRRNSAPKGSVSSLLSFWREKERAAPPGTTSARVVERERQEQDERIMRDRQTMMLKREAKAKAAAAAATPASATSSTKQSPVVVRQHPPPAIDPITASIPILPLAATFTPLASHGLDVSCLIDSSSVASTLSPPPTALSEVETIASEAFDERSITDVTSGSSGTTASMMSSPTPSLPPSDDIDGPAATAPCAIGQATIPETQTLRQISQPLPQTDTKVSPEPALVQQHAQQPQPAALLALPPLTRTVTDVCADPAAVAEAAHEDDQATESADAAAPSAARSSHHLSALSVSSIASSANASTFDFDGVPLDSPAQSSGGAGPHATHSRFESNVSIDVTLSEFAVVPAPDANLPPLTREVTDFVAQPDHAHGAPSASTTAPEPPLDNLPPLTRVITDFAPIGATNAATSIIQSAALPALTRTITDPAAFEPTSEDPSAEISPPQAHVSQTDAANLAPYVPAVTGVPAPPPALTRLVTDPISADVPEEDLPPTRPLTPVTSASSSPAIIPALPPITRVHTELDLNAVQAEEEAAVEKIPQVAAPPLLARVQTELPLPSETTDGEAATATVITASTTPSSLPPIVAPPLTRLRTELDVVGEPPANEEATEEIAAIPAAISPEDPLMATLPPLQRVQTELDLAGGESSSVSASPAGSLPIDTSLVDESSFVDEDDAAHGDEVDEAADLVPASLPTEQQHGRRPSVSVSASRSSLSLTVDSESEYETGGEPHERGAHIEPASPSQSSSSLNSALQSPPPVPPSPAAARAAGDAHLRARVEAELLSSEATYVASLGVLVTQFIHPLKLLAGSLRVTPAQLALIFSNVELLYNFHCVFHADLARAVAASQLAASEAAANKTLDAETTTVTGGTSVTPRSGSNSVTAASSPSAPATTAVPSVGDTILKCADFLRMYTQYLAQYPVGLDTLASLRSNAKWQQFLLEKRQQSVAAAATGDAAAPSGLDLMSYLIMPVQRIPRYLLLLKELLRFTPKDHPELLRLQEAYVKVQSIAVHVNEQQRHVETMSTLLSIQNSISSGGGAEFGQLMMPHRRLVRSGILLKMTSGLIASSHPRKIYLFNDCLLWCEPGVDAKTGSSGVTAAPVGEKFRGHIELDGASVREHFERGGRTGVRITAPIHRRGSADASGGGGGSKSKKEVVFLCPGGSDEKQAWMSDIRSVISTTRDTAEEVRKRRLSTRVKNVAATCQNVKAAHERRSVAAHTNATVAVAAAAATAATHSPGGRTHYATLPSPKSPAAIAAAAAAARSSPPTGKSMHEFLGAKLKELKDKNSAAAAAANAGANAPAPLHVPSPRSGSVVVAGTTTATTGGVSPLSARSRVDVIPEDGAPSELHANAVPIFSTLTPTRPMSKTTAGPSRTSKESAFDFASVLTSEERERTEPLVRDMTESEWVAAQDLAGRLGRRGRVRPMSF